MNVTVTIDISDRLLVLVERALTLGEGLGRGQSPMEDAPNDNDDYDGDNDDDGRNDYDYEGEFEGQAGQEQQDEETEEAAERTRGPAPDVWAPADVAADLLGLSELTVKAYGREGKLPRRGKRRHFQYRIATDTGRTLHTQTLLVGDELVSPAGKRVTIVAIDGENFTYERQNGKNPDAR